MNLRNESCEKFSELLAAKSPVPGGGGAAALVGALGAALCSMSANFTIGKKKYADVEADIKIILENSERLRARLLELIDEDAAAYESVSAAYKIPKDDPSRESVLDIALLQASKTPLEIVKACGEIIDLMDDMVDKSNMMLISDVGCGVLLARAAMEAASMNVFINTAALSDTNTAKSLELQIDGLLDKNARKASDVAERVSAIIRKKA
ncbi:MAG: cyclodeaminase/cyclohydrolase family protein [Synergistaceae bacterium]|nr:cyclodeaminase/cyclohydrolase family protein [Synergistaceae bacterium]